MWREALLARAVLRGKTVGYRRHPQLQRFLAHAMPRSAITAYLGEVHREALRRGYAFDRSKIGPLRAIEPIAVTRGQIEHEWAHLLRKLSLRSPELYRRWRRVRSPQCHPLIRARAGGVEPWERGVVFQQRGARRRDFLPPGRQP